MNFSLMSTGVGLTADTAGTVTALPPNPTGVEEMMVYNPGPLPVRLKTGLNGMSPAASTGNARAMVILAGEKGTWRIGNSTHYSAQVSSGTQEIEVYLGMGE